MGLFDAVQLTEGSGRWRVGELIAAGVGTGVCARDRPACGALDFADGLVDFLQRGGDGVVVAGGWLCDGPGDSSGGRARSDNGDPLAPIADEGDVLERQGRSPAGESVEAGLEEREQLEQQIVGQRIGDFGPVGFEQAGGRPGGWRGRC